MALKNELAEQSKELSEVKAENKLLRREQHRLQKNLEKYESEEAQLPQLLKRHQEEVGVWKGFLFFKIDAVRFPESCGIE